jgi:hypothetical protein
MEAIEYDDLERSKTRVKKLKGSLARELLHSVVLRIEDVYPEATRAHVVLYPDNVYRIWALSAGKRWVTVCEDDVAPTWTSINLDRDIDLIARLGWTARLRPYNRADGVEVLSLELRTWEAENERRKHGNHRTRHVAQREVPVDEDRRPVQGRQQYEHGEAVRQAQEVFTAAAGLRDGEGAPEER